MKIYTFEQGMHVHHGYYENGVDIESIAYRVKGEGRWVMFIDGETLRALLPSRSLPEFDEAYGLDFLCVYADDLDDVTGADLLEGWLRGLSVF